jgi:hypothetical protein
MVKVRIIFDLPTYITRQALLAIVRTRKHFHKYLYRREEFHLCNNHFALTWLMSFKNLKGQTVCWIQRLQEYNFTSDFTSEYCQGRKHNNAMHFRDSHAEKSVSTATKLRYGQTSSRCELLWI